MLQTAAGENVAAPREKTGMRRALCLLGVVAVVCWVAAPSSRSASGFATADVQGFMAASPAVFNARAPAPAMQVGPVYERRDFAQDGNTVSWATGTQLATRDAAPDVGGGWTTSGAVYSRRPPAPNDHPELQQAWASPIIKARYAGAPQPAKQAPPPQGVDEEAAKRAWLAKQEAPAPQGPAPPKASRTPTKPDQAWAATNTNRKPVPYRHPRQAASQGQQATWATGPAKLRN
jgi:hypothetical protein